MGVFDNADPENMEYKPLPVTIEKGAPANNIYLVEAKAGYKVSKGGADMMAVVFNVIEPEEFVGRSVKDYLLFSPIKYKNTNFSALDSSLAKLQGLFGTKDENPAFYDALDGDIAEDVIPALVAKMDGLVMAIKINQKESEYQGEKRIQNNIVGTYRTMDKYGEEDDE